MPATKLTANPGALAASAGVPAATGIYSLGSEYNAATNVLVEVTGVFDAAVVKVGLLSVDGDFIPGRQGDGTEISTSANAAYKLPVGASGKLAVSLSGATVSTNLKIASTPLKP